MRTIVACLVGVLVLAVAASLVDAKPRVKKRTVKRFNAAGVVESRKAGRLQQVTYSVADLVVPIDYVPQPEKNSTNEQRGTIERQLIDLIARTVAPRSWDSAGGPGSMEYYPLGMALVVNQTSQVHEEIADLLAALRRLQDLQIVLEVRLMDVSTALLATVAADEDMDLSAKDRAVLLSADQVERVLATAQQDRQFNMMQAPKVTVFNGQSVRVDITDKVGFITDFEVITKEGQLAILPKTEQATVGMQLSLLPVASADRQSVRVGLCLELAALESAPLSLRQKLHKRSVESKLDIPPGQTALLDAGMHGGAGYATWLARWVEQLCHGRLESLPCSTCRQTVLLVTPRLIDAGDK